MNETIGVEHRPHLRTSVSQLDQRVRPRASSSAIQRVWACRASRRRRWHQRPQLLAILLCMLGSLAAAAEPQRIDALAAADRAVEVSQLAVAASERVAAADASIAAADAARWPTAVASASASRRSSVPELSVPFSAPGEPPLVLAPDITATYGTGVRLQQVVLAGGAVAAQRRATRLDADSMRAQRAKTVAELRYLAGVTYWSTVRARASSDLARAHERRAQRLLADTQALFAVGMAVRADVLAAEERVASARLALLRAESVASRAHGHLASLLGLDPNSIELADSLADPTPDVLVSLDDLTEKALSGRPELVAARAAHAALAAREQLAAAPTRPSLSLHAGWELARPNQRYFPATAEWNDSWSVGLAAGWTLFDGGRSRAEQSRSRAQQRAAAAELEELRRQVLLEVEDAARELRTARAALTAAEAAAAAAAARQQAAVDRHAGGLAAMSEILDAETQLANAEMQQVTTRVGIHLALAALQKAVGQ